MADSWFHRPFLRWRTRASPTRLSLGLARHNSGSCGPASVWDNRPHVFKVANIERIGDTAAPEKGATAAEKKRKKKLDAKRNSAGSEASDDEEAPPSADDDDDDSEEIVDSDDEKEAAAKRKSAANSEKPAATLHLKATTKKGKLICFGKIDYEEGAKFTIGKAPSGNKIAVPEEHAAVLRVDDVHCARRAIRRNSAQFGARFSDAQCFGAIL